VTSLPQTTLKTQLPPSLWVSTGTPKLALVTCGGPFDSATGHYLDNVIVWAAPAPGPGLWTAGARQGPSSASSAKANHASSASSSAL
jgi:hypothetical protein